ncbi:MAG: AAA family ATPase, partial [Prolixibacteraceae bacterium]
MDKETIKKILVENHEFISKVELVKRDVIFEEAGNYVLVGSRRAGKTYCMLQVIKDMLSQGADLSSILYVNFEDERLLELKITELNLIVEAFKELFTTTPVYFLDEIQNIVGWEKFARRLADSGERVF